MFRGYRRLVCSLVCVFSILCMLYLDTCTVEAATGNYNFSLNATIKLAPNSISNETFGSVYGSIQNNYSTTGGGIAGGGGTITGRTDTTFDEYYTYHVKIPFQYNNTWTLGGDADTLYKVLFRCGGSPSVSVSEGSISNVAFYDREGNMLFTGVSAWNGGTFYYYGSELHTIYDGVDGGLRYYFTLEFDFCDYKAYQDDNAVRNITVSMNDFNMYIQDASADEVASQTQKVTESNSKNIENNTQSTADNTSGILSKITDFFGSFFENLIGIFVPEDGYFSGWFDRVNTLLSDKLGMLYAPFDLVISTLQAIYSSDSTESGIPFPGIKWEDTWLVEPFTFTFASLGSDFDDLRDKVYFATDTVLVFTFLMLLQSKVKLILEGHE